MPQANIEIVRRFLDGYEGQDVIPDLRSAVEKLGPAPDTEAVLALWADNPAWRHAHPAIEWDTSGRVAFDMSARGAAAVSATWTEWLETWDSYVYRTAELRELGEWVLATSDLEAEGRGGIPVKMRIFQLFHVRDEKVDVCRVFFNEADALEAVGAST